MRLFTLELLELGVLGRSTSTGEIPTSLSDISDDVVKQATDFLRELLENKLLGELWFDGLGVEAGIVTYHRHTKGSGSITTPLPNNYQP